MSLQTLSKYVVKSSDNILTINIDCAPGANRPDYYFNLIIDDLCYIDNKDLTILEKKYLETQKNKDTLYRTFGNWCWEIKLTGFINYNGYNYDVSIDKKKILEMFRTKLQDYYKNNFIRYASWC